MNDIPIRFIRLSDMSLVRREMLLASPSSLVTFTVFLRECQIVSTTSG